MLLVGGGCCLWAVDVATRWWIGSGCCFKVGVVASRRWMLLLGNDG
jgi:hypothetical protein